ncbi:MAG TPA: aldehyde dehydrogenase family protein [Planctomycetota bacterium]|nr:aldehyde dehydrogenase family protein [Planctomycetota bacterium]
MPYHPESHLPGVPPMKDLMKSLGIDGPNPGAHNGAQALPTGTTRELKSHSPIDGTLLGSVYEGDVATYEAVMKEAEAGFRKWRSMPAPARGEVVRQMGNALRAKKAELGRLVSLEMGKLLSEGEGEVQEMIDIADFAVGLSRQLYGMTMPSERPGHRMYEQWQPLGVVGIITAFNFPVAVWAWNAMLAAVCGDAMVWKPSRKTPLSAVAVQRIIEPIVKAHNIPGVFSMVIGGDQDVGEAMIHDRRLPLISATGSCRMGRHVGQAVAGRLGRSLLELGGNNGIVVLPDADLELVKRAVLFGAVGTAGQRCTTTRRLFLHQDIYDQVVGPLVSAYQRIPIGNPLNKGILMGPLIDEDAVKGFEKAVAEAKAEGGEVLCGGQRAFPDGLKGGTYVQPTMIRANPSMRVYREETFAPILYVFSIRDLDEAIALHNGVDQGLSSAIFTTNLLAAERWLSAAGSDCGIANVNIGTSGAEIGGAFGGEKDTGGGRESGSDSWKAYMRRQTVTINYTKDLPLAQGVSFDLPT